MEKRQSWGSLYYSFDGGDTWHKKRSEAFNAAKEAGKLWEVKEQNSMPSKKKTTRRKNSDRLTQAQINDLPYMQRIRVDNELSSVFLRKDKAYVTKNANGTVTVHVSKADGHNYTVIYDKKGKALNPSKRRNATIIKAKRIEHLDVSKIHNPGKSTRRNKTIITKPKKVVVVNGRKKNPNYTVEARPKYDKTIKEDIQALTRGSAIRKLKKVVPGPNSAYTYRIEKNPKTTRRKYRNGYLDLVIMGHAKKTPSGWLLGGKTFKQGKGIVPASKRGYYLDLGTGTVFSKKARNVAQGFFDGNGVFHPIRSSSDYDAGTAGETGKKPIRTRSKKRKTALKKASQTARLKAETKRRKSTTSRLASRSLSKSAGILKGSGSRRQRNPRYFAYGIDANGREHDLAVRVAQNKTQTLAWVKKNYPGYKKYVVELSEKFDFIGPKGGVKIKRPKRVTAKKNPSVKSIRKEFAGTVGKASDVFAPIGTPKNVAKLGKLLLIDTENATIKPTGIVYLCADSKGKLHLCGAKNVPIYSGAAQSFGQVKKLEYETAKPHLYPGQGTIQFWHKMGEESGNRPTLYADGKGGLKFRGGSYKITREGIVD